MLTIGVDPHKQTHSAVAVDELGVKLAAATRPARREGCGELLAWSRVLAGARVWVIEDCRIPERALVGPGWQVKVARGLQRAEATVRVRIATGLIRRVIDLTRTINALADELGRLVREVSPQLLAEPGIGVLIAAKLIGE